MSSSHSKRMTNNQNCESMDETPEERIRLTGKSIGKSCLILQIALYFNIYFSPIYFVTFYLSCQSFMNELREMEIFFTKTLLTIGSIIEIPRLVFGYTGNYNHRVPHILCFWLMTTFIQFPVQLLMQTIPLTTKPFLATINVIMIIFLIFEISVGIFVFRWLVKLIPRIKQS
ncbi:transmembrane protein 17-like [Panonychus citri]|uniref:transmembrane protein 17-like n=1 Tax=Panonychus citri TaxID=50023 RepID=UPI0023083677|nr:transmembrane protein 17-like [Panonychus citri]